MTLDRRHHLPLLGFLLLSLLLHLLVLVLWPAAPASVPSAASSPLQVRLVEEPARPRELDLPIEPSTPRTRPAKRLGPSDREVERETAPPGTFPDEQQATAATRPAPPIPPAPPASPSTPPRPPTETTPEGRTGRSQPHLPDRRQLLASSNQAAQNVVDRQVAEWRSKLRDQVERGEAVWLNTETDQLGSFFRRFRDGIYLVWNYPRAAAENGEEGTCLLRITVNRAGVVEEVLLLESSGSARLDNEAIEAVRKGSRYYGYLPASYREERLTIFAFFNYQLGYKPKAFGAN